MSNSIRPSITKHGGKIAGGLGGGSLAAVVIIYLINQLNAAPDNAGANQAMVDAKQDMRIEQNQKEIAEGKQDRKEILRKVNRMDRIIVRIDEKLGR